MKHKLTHTDNYILIVDDSEIKEGDCYLSPSGIWFYNHLNPNHIKECKKVIAHLPLNNSPILEGVDLLQPILIENGKEDFVEYIKQKHNQERCVGFMDGWNKHAEKYKYTEEDMKYMFECGRNYQNNAEITFKIAMEYLSQPKMPTHFEYIDTITTDEGTYPEWVGNWIYE